MRMSTTALLGLLSLTGCSAETDLETAFCELLSDGPETDVTATTDGAGPELAAEDQVVEVTLQQGSDGMYSGMATYTADEAGSFAMGLSDDVPFTVFDSAGEALPWDSEIEGASCDDLAIRYTVTLEKTSYTIEFGPTDTDEVGFVSEESDDDL